VKIYQSILTYLLLFLGLALILKFFGLISLTGSEIFSYALIFYGISDVYLSIGRNRKISLFLGTIFFLVGILFYVLNNFLIFWDFQLLLPSILIIPGIAYLMLNYDNPSNKKFLIIGTVLIFAGLLVTIINGQFNLLLFYQSLFKISSLYWQIALVAAGILILISFEERK
jgi:hypothetical protein